MGSSFEEKENDLKYPDWQIPLRGALLELDKDKLKQRLIDVETAIFNRQQALSGRADSRDEEQAIGNALATLRVLRRECLGFPDWESCHRDVSRISSSEGGPWA